jgi:hypothetical protein
MISAWTIVASRVFSLPAVHDLTLAGALAISGLALVGLIAHELSLEHPVQPARDGPASARTGSPPPPRTTSHRATTGRGVQASGCRGCVDSARLGRGTGRGAEALRALPSLSCRAIHLDRMGGAGEHQEWATGGTSKLPGGASVDQAPDRPIAAPADDQQIERCAVPRELLGRLTVGRVWFDAAQARDSLKGVSDETLGRVVGRSGPHKGE